MEMMKTYNSIICQVTDDYLESMDPDTLPAVIECELLNLTNEAIAKYNEERGKGYSKERTLRQLAPYQMARILIKLHHAIKLYLLGFGEKDNVSIALYHVDGADAGTYDVSDECVEGTIRKYCPNYSTKDVVETYAVLRSEAPAKVRCNERELVAVNNGLFHLRTKTLMDFDPELVFTSKSHVDYVDNPSNPRIVMEDGEVWDVESWMKSLSDDEGVSNLLWQMVGSVIRPNTRWDKAILMYATSGNNGKGTLCALMRNLCGPGTHTSIPVKDFGKDFMLLPLMRVSAVIVDENDTDSFLDSADGFKAAITHDVMRINVKYKEPKDIRFNGIIIECVNALPKFQDKSGSLYRRLLPIPMTKSFQGIERKYIKDDYLKRDDVLQYVLWRVLHMDYYEFDEPKACKELLSTLAENNDPVRQFLTDVLPKFQWNGVSWEMLFDLFVGWYKRNFNKLPNLSKKPFKDSVCDLLSDYPEWTVKPKFRASTYISGPEPLFVEYEARKWFDHGYHGSDINKMVAIPDGAKLFAGIVHDLSMVTVIDEED